MNIVEKVSLRNFRCYDEFELDCNRATSLIVGENGSGKTSILEAIYLALRGKSFKGVDREIMKRDAEFYRAEVTLADARDVIIRFDGKKKTFEVDNRKSLRLPKKDKYPVVLFEPDDLYLVGSSPARRRDYFDELFKQMDSHYALALGKYNKALKQRNDLLKNDEINVDDLFSWNVMCANYGDIAKNSDECSLHYLGEDCDENKYLAILEQNFDRDRFFGYTSFGVHRDDFEFVFNGKKADGSASRGEIRSMILALKFIEARILEAETGYAPVVLLDDIFSELDNARQKHLVENFKDYQMIITSTAAPADLDISKTLQRLLAVLRISFGVFGVFF